MVVRASPSRQRSAGAARGAVARSIAVPDLPRDLPNAAAALEPLLRALEQLPADGVLKAELACDPAPVVGPLAERGFCARVEKHARRRWTLEVRPEGGPPIMDLRGLEAPEPMERILKACAKLAPGAALMARTPCHPHPLFSQLERRGLLWGAHEEPDGSALVHIRRPR